MSRERITVATRPYTCQKARWHGDGIEGMGMGVGIDIGTSGGHMRMGIDGCIGTGAGIVRNRCEEQIAEGAPSMVDSTAIRGGHRGWQLRAAACEARCLAEA